MPDQTTILDFRRLLETHDLAPKPLERVNVHLARKGQSLKAGTIVDATIIAAPSSTRNKVLTLFARRTCGWHGVLTAKECCSLIEYLYRDGGNFKTYGRLLLTGCAADAEQAIRGCLEWGDQFVVEEFFVLPGTLEAAEDGPSDLDHAYHEFVTVRPCGTGDDDLKVWGSLDETSRAYARGSWQVGRAPNAELRSVARNRLTAGGESA